MKNIEVNNFPLVIERLKINYDYQFSGKIFGRISYTFLDLFMAHKGASFA